ncbi:hypothetical protein [Actinophytocola sp.]|uniref:hypothetical protein n=1 Tax=Actinophytocola sp. TaxID=1872138 RepID=UPI003D6B2048
MSQGEEPRWEVFARRELRRPLTHLGSVDAPNPEMARARAWAVYARGGWKEMAIAPAAAFTPVVGGYATIGVV